MQDPNRARLDDLARRLKSVDRPPAEGVALREGARPAGNASSGMRIVTELLAGVLGGLLLGWFLDRWLETSPWLLVTFLCLGTAAAFRNVWKLASRPSQGGGQEQGR